VGIKKLKEILSWKKPRKSNTKQLFVLIGLKTMRISLSNGLRPQQLTAAMVDGIAAMGHGWSIVRIDLQRLLVASLSQVLTTC